MDDKRPQTCCFTGHRLIRPDRVDMISARTEIKVRELIVQHGVRYFGVGGALGYDTMVANILFQLRATDFPHIKVILVYPFEVYTSRWTEKQKDTYNRMLPKYNKCVCVAQHGCREAYLARNRHLVNSSAYCICYHEYSTGGTAYTVEYAKSKGVTVLNVFFNNE